MDPRRQERQCPDRAYTMRNKEINTKYLIAGWAIVITLFIMACTVLNRKAKSPEELNGYMFSWEDNKSDTHSRINVWIFTDSRTASVERYDIVNSNYLPDTRQKYSIKLSEDEIFLILDIYQKKESTGLSKNTKYDQAVVNAVNIIKNGNIDEALKELRYVLKDPE